ncbi:MAG TPA: hypothetical protein VGQ56_00410 [Gemmatimonadaceae bacterium]|jgi:hypothetical protein|nr:hypothetical protein [Gemmatimonadaceae bacterium]
MTTTKKSDTIRIELTPEQSEKIQVETGRTVTTIELTLQELESRLTPFHMIAANHNETLLAE